MEQLRELLNLPINGWLLDGGGSTDRVSYQLCELIDNLVVSDSSLPMLKQAQSKGELWTVQALTEQLPFPKETFDCVLVVDALHHFVNKQIAIRELLRVLRTGGRLVIQEPNINRFTVIIVAIIEKLILMHSHFSSPTEIRDMFAAQDLQLG